HYSDRFDVRIAALCERDPEIASRVSREYGIRTVYSDVESFSMDETLDCYVVIIRPRALKPVLKTLVRRRAPIFTEKPPGFSADEAEALAGLIDVPNVVAFNRRYFPIVETFRQLLNELDGIYYVDCSFYRSERYDSQLFSEGKGSNASPFVMGTGLHAINLLEYLFGEIASCRSTNVSVPTNATQAWLCDLDFASGLAGRLKMLPCTGSAVEWIEVHSQCRSLHLHHGMYGKIDYPGTIWVHEGGELTEIIHGDGELPRLVNVGFVGKYLEFFQAVAAGGPTRSNFRNAVNSIRVAEGIETSRRPEL
ncbi:MAG: Gfo/Idh/MocA family oxidoreductase, partial [Anaerolineae bacterium]|nr:Gfo/Idh/MocA family oxidoreductase [Anaerolineae bacterium]